MEENISPVHFKVTLFGEMEVSGGGRELREKQMKSTQLVKLLAYLFLNLGRHVSDSELRDVLWDGEISNPSGALKNLVYRLRRTLAAVWPDVNFVITSNGEHFINPDLSLDIDILEFRQLIRKYRGQDKEQGLEDLIRAADLYKGKVVKNLNDLKWERYVQIWYCHQYIELISQICEELIARKRMYDAEMWAINAVMLEPEEEQIHVNYLRVCLAQNKKNKSMEVFNSIVHNFYHDDLESISPELQEIRARNFPHLSDSLRQLKDMVYGTDKASVRGPLLCQLPEFVQILRMERRWRIYQKRSSHVLVIDVIRDGDEAGGGSEDSKDLQSARQMLLDHWQASLRPVDVVTTYGSSRSILLLPELDEDISKKTAESARDLISGKTDPRCTLKIWNFTI